MALADDELTMGNNHTRNGEWINITMRKVNILLMDEDADWENYLKYINVVLKDDLLVLKQAKLEAITFQIQNTELTKLNHALQEQLKEERKINEKWLTIMHHQAVNECLKPTEASNNPESSKDSESKSLTPLPPLKNIQGASPSFEVMPLTYQPHSPKGEKLGLVPTKVKDTEQESKINELTKLVHILMDEKINLKTHEQKPKSSNSGSSTKVSQDVKSKS
ncbi:hypothetical protein Tco_0961479 [Tanacetum coccineum]